MRTCGGAVVEVEGPVVVGLAVVQVMMGERFVELHHVVVVVVLDLLLRQGYCRYFRWRFVGDDGSGGGDDDGDVDDYVDQSWQSRWYVCSNRSTSMRMNMWYVVQVVLQ